MESKSEILWKQLDNPEFRKQFIDAHVDEGIAFQIRSLRNKRKKTQPEFSLEMGVKQSLLSTWENPNYGKYTIRTLKKIAQAFDVGLLVRFVPFSTLIEWTINQTPESIAPPSFQEEQALDNAFKSSSVPPENRGERETTGAGFNYSTEANTTTYAVAENPRITGGEKFFHA